MKKDDQGICRFAKAGAILLLLSSTLLGAQTLQEHVHQMAPGVMPFDMSKTLHIFKMTESRDVMRVIARDPGDADQVALVQQHLRREAENFQRGNYADPAALHGQDMPGLKDLRAGAARIHVSCATLPAGAEITFQTTNLRLLTAVHRWFGAQLSEHGGDAKAE